MSRRSKYNIDEYTGKTINSFYITGKTKMHNNRTYWEFKCLCGNSIMYRVPSRVLVGRVKSCKKCSIANARGPECPTYKGTKNIPASVLRQIEHRCRKSRKHIKVEITLECLQKQWDIQDGKCAFTGRALVFRSSGREGTASVDRIDSSGEYTPDNIQIVHKVINNMKQELSDTEFRMFCKEVTEYGID